MKKCTEQDCDGKHKARGLCHKHYQRLLATGAPRRPYGVLVKHPNQTTDEALPRFCERFVVDQNTGCWEWTHGRGDNGYAQFSFNLKIVPAHRFSYMAYKGEIPTGMRVLHKCDNDGCVNPDHLSLGTHQENMADMYRKGRNRGRLSLSIDTLLEMAEMYYVHCYAIWYIAKRFDMRSVTAKKHILKIASKVPTARVHRRLSR